MLLHLLDAIEVIPPQPFCAYCPVVAFDIGILLWLAWLDEFQPDILLISPLRHCRANVLRPIVTTNRFRFTSPFNNPFQCADDTFTR